MMDKNETLKGFIMYQSFRKPLEKLSPQNLKTLIEAMYQYCYDNESPQIEEGTTLEIVWSFIEPLLKKQIEHYQSSSKGGRNKCPSEKKSVASNDGALLSEYPITW